MTSLARVPGAEKKKKITPTNANLLLLLLLLWRSVSSVVQVSAWICRLRTARGPVIALSLFNKYVLLGDHLLKSHSTLNQDFDFGWIVKKGNHSVFLRLMVRFSPHSTWRSWELLCRDLAKGAPEQYKYPRGETCLSAFYSKLKYQVWLKCTLIALL